MYCHAKMASVLDLIAFALKVTPVTIVKLAPYTLTVNGTMFVSIYRTHIVRKSLIITRQMEHFIFVKTAKAANRKTATLISRLSMGIQSVGHALHGPSQLQQWKITCFGSMCNSCSVVQTVDICFQNSRAQQLHSDGTLRMHLRGPS